MLKNDEEVIVHMELSMDLVFTLLKRSCGFSQFLTNPLTQVSTHCFSEAGGCFRSLMESNPLGWYITHLDSDRYRRGDPWSRVSVNECARLYYDKTKCLGIPQHRVSHGDRAGWWMVTSSWNHIWTPGKRTEAELTGRPAGSEEAGLKVKNEFLNERVSSHVPPRQKGSAGFCSSLSPHQLFIFFLCYWWKQEFGVSNSPLYKI